LQPPLPDLHSHVARLQGLRVLVVGDLTLDEYLFGRPTRLSREAPIPVLELEQRTCILGGAANPARNIVALGSTAIPIGVVGADPQGQQLCDLFAAAQISTAQIIVAPDRPTTVKTRILAHEVPRLPQQVARLDQLARRPLTPTLLAQIEVALAAQIPHVDAVLCSDYQLGMLVDPVIARIRQLCEQHGVLLTVDAQGNALAYRGVGLFRCNDREAAATLQRSLQHEADFRAALPDLLDLLEARLVIVTRGPEGLSMQGRDVPYTYMPASQLSEVYDTTGAGDTFIAVVTLGLAGGLAADAAAQLANLAAGRVVRKLGNIVVTPEELTQAMQLLHPANQ